MRFIFDTAVEDVLLSRDCEVTKQGKTGVFVVALKSLKPALTVKFLPFSISGNPFYSCDIRKPNDKSIQLYFEAFFFKFDTLQM